MNKKTAPMDTKLQGKHYLYDIIYINININILYTVTRNTPSNLLIPNFSLNVNFSCEKREDLALFLNEMNVDFPYIFQV